MFWRQGLLSAIAAIALAGPAVSESIATAPVVRPAFHVYHAYQGASGSNGAMVDRGFCGYAAPTADVITAVPGVLRIDPGHKDLNGNGVFEPDNEMWRNYVLAAQVGVPYTTKNVVLVKQTPDHVQCSEIYYSTSVVQHGTQSMRFWWSLLFEAPGTTWTLTILYGTGKPWDDDGPGPNPAGFVHCEVWEWELDVTVASLTRVLEAFHELPFGLSSAPLISDEATYGTLHHFLDSAQKSLDSGDTTGAGLALSDFELTVADRCIATPPSGPAPGGYGTGIAQTSENPVCCKLMVDAEYVGQKYGLFQQSK